MSIDMAQLAPYIWIVAIILAIIVAFAVIRFFWHHILRYLLHGCVVILGILAVLAVLHFYFKLF
jgi:hypothetical protein